MSAINLTDLAGVVYSSGKVFDGLSTGRLDTENFLRSGDLGGVSSRADLALLEDLRDVAEFILEHGAHPVDAAYVRAVNARIIRSGAIHPGRLRTQEQIVVRTRHGRHLPEAITDAELQRLVDTATGGDDPVENALDLLVDLAKAQPFEDGNKRTALFVANSLLIGAGTNVLLTIPVDETDPGLADSLQRPAGEGLRPRRGRRREGPAAQPRAHSHCSMVSRSYQLDAKAYQGPARWTNRGASNDPLPTSCRGTPSGR